MQPAGTYFMTYLIMPIFPEKWSGIERLIWDLQICNRQTVLREITKMKPSRATEHAQGCHYESRWMKITVECPWTVLFYATQAMAETVTTERPFTGMKTCMKITMNVYNHSRKSPHLMCMQLTLIIVGRSYVACLLHDNFAESIWSLWTVY